MLVEIRLVHVNKYLKMVMLTSYKQHQDFNSVSTLYKVQKAPLIVITLGPRKTDNIMCDNIN
jgi:hypothetical protein